MTTIREYGFSPADYAGDDSSGFIAPATGTYEIYLPPASAGADPSTRVTTGLTDLAGTPITVVTASVDTAERGHLKFLGVDLPSSLYFKAGTKFFVTHASDVGSRVDALETDLAAAIATLNAAIADAIDTAAAAAGQALQAHLDDDANPHLAAGMVVGLDEDGSRLGLRLWKTVSEPSAGLGAQDGDVRINLGS